MSLNERITRREWEAECWSLAIGELGRIAIALDKLPRWAWLRRRRLLTERRFVKAMNYHVLYGGGGGGIDRCTIPADDHGDTCNGWPCEMVARKLIAAGEDVPGPPYGDTGSSEWT